MATNSEYGKSSKQRQGIIMNEDFCFLWYPNTEENGCDFSQEEIIRHAHMYNQEDHCGVYFLISVDEIVYVGQTKNLKDRLRAHWNSDKAWTRYFFIRCEPEELNIVEAYYILRFRPKYNIAIPKVKL